MDEFNIENIRKHSSQLLRVVNKINSLHFNSMEQMENYIPIKEAVSEFPNTNIQKLMIDHREKICKCNMSFLNCDTFAINLEDKNIEFGMVSQRGFALLEHMNRNGYYIWMLHLSVLQLMSDYVKDKEVQVCLEYTQNMIKDKINFKKSDTPFDMLLRSEELV